MPELSVRMPCPVCLGVKMDKVTFDGTPAEIDRCGRCGGVWVGRDEARQLGSLARADVEARIPTEIRSAKSLCHRCGSLFDRKTGKCPSCNTQPELDCPDCGERMKVVRHGGIELDVCRKCEGVWFDHEELGIIWNEAIGKALQKRRATSEDAAVVGSIAAEVAFDTMIFAPELFYAGIRGAGAVAGASAEMLSNLPGAVGAAPEVAGAAFEVVGEAAGGVFKAILEIVTGILDNL